MSSGLNRRILLAIVLIAGVVISSVTVVLYLQQQTQPEVVLTINVNDSSANYTMADLMSISDLTYEAGFVKTGTYPPIIVEPASWTGIPLFQLLTSVGELPANYSLKVQSSDGYTTIFTRKEVMGMIDAYDPDTGEAIGAANFTLLLTYQQDGEFLTNETGGPLRLGWIPDGDYMAAGHSWPKFVREITVIDETEPWTLALNGVNSWNMTHDVYYSLGSCSHHQKSITLDEKQYFGVGLWTLVASMDGGNDVHYSFNNSLVATNYTVTVWNSSGAQINFSSYDIAFNDNIIITGWGGDELLTPPEWPLKLVTSGGIYLDNVVRINMTGWE